MGGNEKSVAVAVDRADAVKGELWTFETLITEYANWPAQIDLLGGFAVALLFRDFRGR
jgi:hypothetical protein